jgi:hypothetical protein
MLKVLSKERNSVTVEFTGADLKKWYADLGPCRIYICHVLETVVRDAEVCSKEFVSPNSYELIAALKAVVPERFKVTNSGSSVIMNHLLKRFHSDAVDSSYQFSTRMNLLKCVPDDHVFTMMFD